jgi:beta-glucosidase
MGRTAFGGRIWEGFGPDPYLAGIAMHYSVAGIESTGVQSCSKHYITNEQETQRSNTTATDGTNIPAYSSKVDDRTLHEIYLWPFANAVKAGTSSVMCAYNRVNQTYSCANSNLLTTILKEELAFPGYVVSDWEATHDTVPTANAGLDMEMPGLTSPTAYYFGDKLFEAINSSLVSGDRLTDMATRVMGAYFRLGQDADFPTLDPGNGPALLTWTLGHNSAISALFPDVPARDVRGDHAQVTRKIGSAGTVLLKNLGSFLPLTNQTNIAVFGNGSPDPDIGSGYHGSSPFGNQMGTLIIGGGSGSVRVSD